MMEACDGRRRREVQNMSVVVGVVDLGMRKRTEWFKYKSSSPDRSRFPSSSEQMPAWVRDIFC